MTPMTRWPGAMVAAYEGKRDDPGILMSRRALQKTNIGSPGTQYLSLPQKTNVERENFIHFKFPRCQNDDGMKESLRIFRQDGHSIRSRNRCFSIARKMFFQVILCNFFQVDQFRRFVRRAFCENRGLLLLGHYFGTSYELLGLDPTFGLL